MNSQKTQNSMIQSVRPQYDIEDAPTGVGDPDIPNPDLEELLSDRADDGVAATKADAIADLKSRDDMLGFWMQAVGDGTRLEGARNDPIEQRTPLEIAYASGVDETMEFPERVDIAAHLFAQHFGLHIDPSRGHQAKSNSQLYEEEMDDVVGAVDTRYGDMDDEIDRLDDGWDTVSFQERRMEAASILESNRLSYCWVQFVVDDTSWIVHAIADRIGSVDVAPGSIEWLRGVDERIDTPIGQYIAPTALTQHLRVAENMAHTSPSEIGQRTLDIGPGAYQ